MIRNTPQWMGLIGLLAFSGTASARTIVLKPTDMDMMAALAAEAPRYSWASYQTSPGFFKNDSVQATAGHGFLLRYALDKIPKEDRVTYAEWDIPVASFNPPPQVRLYIWRITAEWGAGVSHLFRMIYPKKLEWAMPGARGNSSDRTTKPSNVLRISESGEKTINVTEDVELWHRGAAPNYGWMISVEDPGVLIGLQSPFYDGRASWNLRITYEPQ